MREKSKITDKNSNSKQLTYLAAGAALITLFFAKDTYDPFNTPKLVLLLIIASLSAIKLTTLWQWKYIKENQINFLFIIVALIFAIGGAISVVFSDNLTIALLGDIQRRNGYLAYVALALIAITVSQLARFTNIRNLFRVMILTGFLFSTYGILQMLDRDFIEWNNPYNSVISTVGNPNFASALMAIFSVICVISLFDKNQNHFFKLFAASCLILSMVAIVASNSRQGLISLSFAILFSVSAYIYLIRKKLGLLIILFSISISGLAIAGMLQIGPLTRFLYKGSVTVRGYYWDAALQMLKDYPATGVGFDHYLYYFKEMREVGYPLKYGFTLTSSNAHNTFLQMFANGGMLLGLSYIALTFLTLYAGVNLIKKSSETNKLLSICLVSAWVAFQAQSVISIDNIGISIWGWVLTGAIFGLAGESYSNDNTAFHRTQENNKNVHVALRSFVIAPFILIPTLILSVSLMRMEGDTYRAKILFDNYIVQSSNNPDLSRQLKTELDRKIKSVLELPFSDPTYQVQLAYFLFDTRDQQKAIEVVNSVVEKFPRNITAVESLATMYGILNEPQNVIYWREKLAKLDPWNGENYLQLLRLYKSSGDSESAQRMYNTIISFAPISNEAKSALEELSK
jgi:O-antigen ligase